MSSHRNTASWPSWLLTCAILYGVYLLFAANLSKPELYVALGASALSTLAVAVFGELGLVHFRPTAADLLQIRQVPMEIVADTGKVIYALGLRLFGRPGPPSRLAAAPFYSLGNDPHSAARRALAETYGTMAPNTIVLGIVHDQALILYHQLLAEPPPMILSKPGAGS